jgi:arylsulfatase
LHGEHVTLGQSVHWLTDGREKYVWLTESGDEQLFDVQDDPQELHDLARGPGHEGRVQGWRRRMVETLSERPEGFVSAGELIAGRPVTAVLPTMPAMPTASGTAGARRG